MPVVKMPDGQLVDMPDNPTPEQLRALEEVNQPQSFGDKVLRRAKLFGSDLIKGAASLPALILDAASIDPETGKPPEKFGGASQALQGAMTVPQTDSEKLQSVLTQGMAGAVATPGGLAAPARSAFIGLSSAGGGELAARLAGDESAFLPRFFGGLLGGGVAGMAANRAASFRPNTESLAREATEGISEEMLQKAKAFMESSQKQGVSMDLAQALEAVGAPASNMTTIRNVLANNRAGNRVTQTLRDQPTELSVRATTAIGRMPGTVYGEQQAANNLQEAATRTVEGAKKARTAAVKPLYEAAGDLDESARKELIEIAKGYAAQPGATEELKRSASDFIRKMKGESAALQDGVTKAREAYSLAKTPVERARAQAQLAAANRAMEEAKRAPLRAVDVDTWIGEAVGPYKGTPLSPANPKALGQVKGLAGKLNEWFQAASPEVKAAEAKFAKITEQTINPLKQGPVGQLATPRGYKPDVQASVAKMNSLFASGVDPQAKVSPIKQAARELAKTDREAFADAAKTYYSGKVSQAFEPVLGGAPATNRDAAKNLWNSMFSNEKQFQGMKDTVASVAETYGMNPTQAVRGLENFAQITKALKSQPSTIGGLSREEVFTLGGRNYGADALRVFGFLPFEKAARRLEDTTMANAFRDFDNILTTPEGADILIRLSKVPVMSERAINILANVGGTAATTSSTVNRPGINNE